MSKTDQQSESTLLFIGRLIISLALGGLASAVLQVFSDMLYIKDIKVSILIDQLGRFLFPALIFIYLTNRKLQFKELQLHKFPDIKLLTICLMLIPISFWMIQYIYGINRMIPMLEWMETQEQTRLTMTRDILQMDSWRQLTVNLVLIGLIPALGEELLFRRVIQRFLHTKWKNAFGVILITAILFSGIHMQFQGFFPRLILGCLIGFGYWISKSMWVPILMHFLNNGLQVVFYYLFLSKNIEIDVSEPVRVLWWQGLLSFAITSILMLWIYKCKESKFDV